MAALPRTASYVFLFVLAVALGLILLGHVSPSPNRFMPDNIAKTNNTTTEYSNMSLLLTDDSQIVLAETDDEEDAEMKETETDSEGRLLASRTDFNVQLGSARLRADIYYDNTWSNRGVVIVLHGASGRKENTRGRSLKFQSWGYVAVALNHDTYQDVSEAVRWLRRRNTVATWGGNRNKIGLYGYSRGGEYAAFAALDSNRRTAVQGAMVISGAHLDSADMVTSNAPPFFLVHGTDDPNVPFQGARLLKRALDRRNVRADALFYDNVGHKPNERYGREIDRNMRRFANSVLG